MTHDPLCYANADCEANENYLCDQIAIVRKETLAAAVQRVEELNFWEEHVREFVHRDEAIAAIKGDSDA
jgi:hypothetical protein